MSSQKPLSYKDYLSIDELLSLQKLISKPRQHDEVLFIVAHQTFELWFKLILNELEKSIQLMISGEIEEATRLIRRVAEVEKLLIVQIGVLETIKPVDFLTFRNVLTPASGFQSVQFREIEFISGLKEERYLELHRKDESDYEQLLKRWEAPSLWDAFMKVLQKSGFNLNSNGDDKKKARFESELRAVVKLYSANSNTKLIELAEALLEYDKNFWLWRDHHISMVERVIGRKVGTGHETLKKTMGEYSFDNAGAAYLETTLRKRFFPVLWAARTELGSG